MGTPSQVLAGLPQQWQVGLLLALLPVLVLSSYLVLSSSRRRDGSTLRLPPGPRRLPVLGHLHLLGPLPHRSLWKLARQHGSVMLLRLGTVPAVVVSSPAAARDVMKTHDADCCSRPDTPGPRRLSYGYGLKDVAFAPYDAYWREMRKLFIVELLSMRRVKVAWRARERQVEKLVADLTMTSHGGEKHQPVVALDEHVFGLADGIVGTVAFGSVYGTERLALRGGEALPAGARRRHGHDGQLLRRGLLPQRRRPIRRPPHGRRRPPRARLRRARRPGFFEAVIDQHTTDTEDNNGGGDLVDVLVGLMEQDQRGFSREHVKAVIMDTFIGGIDTSSVTMLWAMSELIRKPRVLKKAQDEGRVQFHFVKFLQSEKYYL
ncbi:unnamed protein product [Urochloa humidicola]